MMGKPIPRGCGFQPKLMHSFAYDRSDGLRNSKQSHKGWAPQNDDKREARLSYVEIGLIEK